MSLEANDPTMFHLLYALLCFLICPSQVFSVSYRAAVVEYAPELAPNQTITHSQALEHNLMNFRAFESYVSTAKTNGSQIIVFPEYGVTGDGISQPKWTDFSREGVVAFTEPIPEPHQGSLCESQTTNHPITTAAACLAKKYSIVIVLNYLDRVNCTIGEGGCQDGKFMYNTAVAFDEEGILISKYHKHRLYGAEANFLDKGPLLNGTSFDTSFGVKFGMFICFDILFQDHPSELLTNFIFPTDWVNAAPFEKALEVQRLWTLDHQKNMLASNYGGFGKGSSGSGIWNKGKALADFFNPSKIAQSHMLIADVPDN